uniref:Large ribosomal subunit protein uL16m n=1 Tax=Clastoptera arizonana TaxID=38151 RepID=A0A1B6CF59_9HEMI
MISLKNLFTMEYKNMLPLLSQVAGIKYFPPPPDYSDIVIPEKPKLSVLPKVPVIPASLRPPKMIKNLRFMRGPEMVHNTLIHKQYGIMALGGGRLKHGHCEMMRLTLGRKIDPQRMFLVWRIEAPWQPITKKGLGHRMGGGKSGINHYVTPIKANRIIIELGGKCEFEEVKGFFVQCCKFITIQSNCC